MSICCGACGLEKHDKRGCLKFPDSSVTDGQLAHRELARLKNDFSVDRAIKLIENILDRLDEIESGPRVFGG